MAQSPSQAVRRRFFQLRVMDYVTRELSLEMELASSDPLKGRGSGASAAQSGRSSGLPTPSSLQVPPRCHLLMTDCRFQAAMLSRPSSMLRPSEGGIMASTCFLSLFFCLQTNIIIDAKVEAEEFRHLTIGIDAGASVRGRLSASLCGWGLR